MTRHCVCLQYLFWTTTHIDQRILRDYVLVRAVMLSECGVVRLLPCWRTAHERVVQSGQTYVLRDEKGEPKTDAAATHDNIESREVPSSNGRLALLAP